MKKITLTFLGALIATVALGATTHYNTAGTQFTKTLKVGLRDREVYFLQKILNSNPATRIGTVGAGSPGNESDYFGALTERAVIKFQELYAPETLTPAGLTAGTGLVGALTRAKLNALPRSTTDSQTPVVITNFRPANPTPGQTVRVNGSGFTAKDNTLTIGSSTVQSLTSLDGLTLAFTLPGVITPGAYVVTVNNASGTSNRAKLTVVKPGLPSPDIESISPAKGRSGTVVTISGSNFLKTGNTVHTGYSTLRGVASPDGETLTVTINPPFFKPATPDPDNDPYIDDVSENTLEFWIYVENSNGRSEPVPFFYAL